MTWAEDTPMDELHEILAAEFAVFPSRDGDEEEDENRRLEERAVLQLFGHYAD
jgi:hypothetical protein